MALVKTFSLARLNFRGTILSVERGQKMSQATSPFHEGDLLRKHPLFFWDTRVFVIYITETIPLTFKTRKRLQRTFSLVMVLHRFNQPHLLPTLSLDGYTKSLDREVRL